MIIINEIDLNRVINQLLLYRKGDSYLQYYMLESVSIKVYSLIDHQTIKNIIKARVFGG